MGEKKEARVKHLAENWTLYKLEAYPWGREHTDPARRNKEHEIVKVMKARGLFAPTTNSIDVNLEILVDLARKEAGHAEGNA